MPVMFVQVFSSGSDGIMEGFHVKVSEVFCLGASLATSGLLYYLYKKSKTTLDKLDVGLDSVQQTNFYRDIFCHVLYLSLRKGTGL